MQLEDLIAERAIYRQLVRFSRAMDARDWDGLAALALPELFADFGVGPLEGRDAVIANIRSYLDHCGVTQHLLGNVLIEVNGDVATSQAYVADMHLDGDNDPQRYFRTLGNYSDTWRRVDDEWLLERRVKDNKALLGTMDVFGSS